MLYALPIWSASYLEWWWFYRARAHWLLQLTLCVHPCVAMFFYLDCNKKCERMDSSGKFEIVAYVATTNLLCSEHIHCSIHGCIVCAAHMAAHSNRVLIYSSTSCQFRREWLRALTCVFGPIHTVLFAELDCCVLRRISSIPCCKGAVPYESLPLLIFCLCTLPPLQVAMWPIVSCLLCSEIASSPATLPPM